nr:hypothetical protein [Tanacetum cinerariifolium]
TGQLPAKAAGSGRMESGPSTQTLRILGARGVAAAGRAVPLDALAHATRVSGRGHLSATRQIRTRRTSDHRQGAASRPRSGPVGGGQP